MAWRFDAHQTFLDPADHYLYDQILGFGPSGAPILPNSTNTTDPDVIRREKLGWEEISVQAAKIVSFIGRLHDQWVRALLPSYSIQILLDMSDI